MDKNNECRASQSPLMPDGGQHTPQAAQADSGLNISSAGLHILAMSLMLCDHLWAMLLPAEEWLTCIGRIAFPIFAFMAAEGYLHTHDLRRYLLRILVWALLSEIPFDLMYGGSMFYPYHQNVLWTFLFSLLIILLAERCCPSFAGLLRTTGSPANSPQAGNAACGRFRFRKLRLLGEALISAGFVLMGFILGYVTMADYYGAGILTVLTFYFFRRRNWKNRLCQFVCLYLLNVKLLGGYYYSVNLFGLETKIVQQGFALLSLIPIWLYRGRQGIRSKGFQYFCYAFYPVHMLLLFALREWILR